MPEYKVFVDLEAHSNIEQDLMGDAVLYIHGDIGHASHLVIRTCTEKNAVHILGSIAAHVVIQKQGPGFIYLFGPVDDSVRIFADDLETIQHFPVSKSVTVAQSRHTFASKPVVQRRRTESENALALSQLNTAPPLPSLKTTQAIHTMRRARSLGEVPLFPATTPHLSTRIWSAPAGNTVRQGTILWRSNP